MKHRERLVILFISFLFLSLSIYPTVRFYLHTPADKVYSFVHNSAGDYSYYVSFIRQGLTGRIATIDQYTTEKQTAGPIHIFYLFLGKIGSLIQLSPPLIYFVARIFFGAFFIASAYLFISFFFTTPKIRITAFIFFLTASPLPHIVQNQGKIEIWQYLFWWTEIDPLRRATFIPHVLMGHIGLTAILLCFLLYFKKRNGLYLIIGIFLGIVTGFAHPPSLGMAYYIFGLFILLSILSVRSKTVFKQLLFPFSLFCLATIPILYYVVRTTELVFPWTLMRTQELQFYAIDLLEYLLALGPLFLLGVLGGILILIQKKKNELNWLFIPVLWVVVDIIMIPLSRILAFTPLPIRIPTFSNIRFLSMALQIPLSILAVYFLNAFSNRWGKKPLFLIIGIYAVLTLAMYPGSVSSQLHDFAGVQDFVYPDKNLVRAFQFLDTQRTQNSTVLTSAKNSLLFPLFARNTLYFGQTIYTQNNADKKIQAMRFFTKEMSGCEAYRFLSQVPVRYILSEEGVVFEKEQYPYLLPVFQKGTVSVYEFLKRVKFEKEC